MRAALLLGLLTACGGGASATTHPVESISIRATMCGVCGMTNEEQPAPRGQVQHRDGTHVHMCSLGDMRAYLEAPSPHGAIVGTWVESLPGDFDPATRRSAEMEWISAEGASYVAGFERPGIMGPPMLSFAERADAEGAQSRVGGQVFDWQAVRATPAHKVPVR